MSWSLLSKQVIICGVWPPLFFIYFSAQISLLRSLSTSLLQFKMLLQIYYSCADVLGVFHWSSRKDVTVEQKNEFVAWTPAKLDCNPFGSTSSSDWDFFLLVCTYKHNIIRSRAWVLPCGESPAVNFQEGTNFFIFPLLFIILNNILEHTLL